VKAVRSRRSQSKGLSQAELDLLDDFDWDDGDKVRDMALQSVTQKTQLGVLAKNVAKSNRIFYHELMCL
jgi:hypothetical protein